MQGLQINSLCKVAKQEGVEELTRSNGPILPQLNAQNPSTEPFPSDWLSKVGVRGVGRLGLTNGSVTTPITSFDLVLEGLVAGNMFRFSNWWKYNIIYVDKCQNKFRGSRGGGRDWLWPPISWWLSCWLRPSPKSNEMKRSSLPGIN